MFGFNKSEIKFETPEIPETPEAPEFSQKEETEEYLTNESSVELVEEKLLIETKPIKSHTSKEQLVKYVAPKTLKPSTISEGFELTGEILSVGNLIVDGKINGNIQAENVTVGSNGLIKGSIKCHTLTVKGEFFGEAACENLSLSGAAVVHGDIQCRSLTMSAGTILTGKMIRI